MMFPIVPRPLFQREQQRGVGGEVHAVRVHDAGGGGRLRRVVLATFGCKILHCFVHLDIIHYLLFYLVF